MNTISPKAIVSTPRQQQRLLRPECADGGPTRECAERCRRDGQSAAGTKRRMVCRFMTVKRHAAHYAGGAMSVDAYFSGQDKSRRLYDRVMKLAQPLEGTKVTATKSQISLRRKRLYAWLWMPGRYLKGSPAPLVLTVALPRRDRSPRWKEVVEPKPGNYIHHLELWKLGDVDKQVRAWLRGAWEEAN